MKGNKEVIDVLQEVLCAELTAINQYFIHARMCQNWRYLGLADHIHKESIGEMKHAQVLIDRILYFDGVPNMQKYMKINVGTTVKEMHTFDLEVEKDAVERLNKGIELARVQGRQRHPGPSRGDPEERGRAHRLDRSPAAPDQGARHRELPGPAGG